LNNITLAIAFLLFGIGETDARAAVPAGYAGTPFTGSTSDAGKGSAGPYPIPGRINLVDYDMGGLNVGFFTTHNSSGNPQFPVGCAGGDYRSDLPVPTLCKTSGPQGDVWYGTGTALDGTTYPTATTAEYYIGAIRPGDWVNVTVNVLTPGTYTLSSTWATGNGGMQLQVYVNGMKQVDWTGTIAIGDYHHWKPFPNFATITLQAGLQVLKFQSPQQHLNLDYVQFSLQLPDGGVDPGNVDGGGGSPGSTAPDAASSGSTSGSPAGSGASTGSSVGTSGATSGNPATSGSGASTGGDATSGGGGAGAGGGSPSGGTGGSSAGASSGGASGGGSQGARTSAGCACLAAGTTAQTGSARGLALGLAGAAVLVGLRRGRRAARR
jgi:hypothetical protein